MSQIKQTYYPTNFTLTLLDGFGTRKPITRSASKKIKASRSQTKMPAFARHQKLTYDKESLLEQIRHEQQKNVFINITNNQLHQNASKKKLTIHRPTSSLLSRHRTTSNNSPLKREVQHLVAQVQKQSQELMRLKTSKKYNRFIELQTLKQTYLQEIKQMKYKIKCFKHELKQQRRIEKQQKKRAKDIRAMNCAVQQRIDTHNAKLAQQLEEVSTKFRSGMMKQLHYRSQRERLLSDIYQLQAKTGRIYIYNKEPQNSVELKRNGEQIRLQNNIDSEEDDSSQQIEGEWSQSQIISHCFQQFEQKHLQQKAVDPVDRHKQLSF